MIQTFESRFRRCGLLAAMICLAAGLGCQPEAPAEADEQVIQHNILGTAYLGQQKWTEAATAFDAALELRGDDPLLLTNKAVALNQQGEVERAVALLERALSVDADFPQAHYNLGLIQSRQGNFERAVEHFEAVARFDSDDLFTQYYLGTGLSRVGREDDAVSALRRALERDPTHVSSLYGLGRLLIQQGDTDEGTRLITLSQQIRARSGLDEAVGGQYGEQGPYAMGVDFPGDAVAAPEPIEVRFRVGPRAQLESGPSGSVAWTLSVLEPEGTPAMLVAQRASLLQLFPAGRSQALAPAAPGERHIAYLEAGDLDNDGRADIAALLAGENGSLIPAAAMQTEDGLFGWKAAAFGGSVERASGLGDLALVDCDHDGDLDLFWCGAGASGVPARCFIATNDGAATFDTRASSEHGFEVRLDGATAPVLGFSDTDNDRDIDLLIADRGGVTLLSNQRDGSFEDISGAVGLGASAAGFDAVAIVDMNKDGWMDLVGAAGQATRLLTNRSGSFNAPVDLDTGSGGPGMLIFDVDNDGFFDVLRTSGARPRVLRNEGRGRWAEQTDRVEAQEGVVDPLAALDVDGDGDLDLVTTAGGVFGLYANDGGNANRWIDLASRGVGDNKFGIGAKVEVLAGGLRQKFEVAGPLPLHAGLGSRTRVQSARYLWPSGVLQDEIELEGGRVATIDQLDRKGTSCPLLYAWRDGRWQFVTDFLGGSAVGYLHAPGVYSTPDTDEYVRIERGLGLDDLGRVGLRLNNQLEEVIWLDKVELVVVDHPEGTSVYPNERLMPGPPFPGFELFASETIRPIRSARGVEDSTDLSDRLRETDRRYVDNFELLRPKGYAEYHTVELDLGEWAGDQRVVLLLDGWIDYADSSANLAAHQAGLELKPPRLTVADGAGGWVERPGTMGFPAGLPKTMAVELSGLFPTSDRRLRIGTNMRIYWDRAQVMLGGADTPLEVTRLSPERASLGFGGFPRELRPGGRKPIAYDPSDVAAGSPWKAHVGYYTGFGDVRSLLTEIDDRFVTTRNGDELELWFESPQPVRPGWSRTYLMFADGFGKDMDPNSAAGNDVGPIPFHGMPVYPYGEDVTPPTRLSSEDSTLRPRLVPPSADGWPGAAGAALAGRGGAER